MHNWRHSSICWLANLAIASGWLVSLEPVTAQSHSAGRLPTGGKHLFSADMPAGVVGTARLQRRGPVQGYYQPASFSGPPGVRFALAQSDTFISDDEGPLTAGLLIGSVYRFKVTEIPQSPGSELYPTVEIIDRTYPPSGLEQKFPIPIVLEQTDLDDALAGNLVTRVIYLEDPQTAFPIAEQPQSGRSIDVSNHQDPLKIADQLGRPVAIVRLGSLLPPTAPELMPQFLFGSPPWIPILLSPETQPSTEQHLGSIPQTRHSRTPQVR